MNKVIGKIHELIFAYTTKRNIRRMERLTDEVAHRLQIREFNGGLVIALDNIPVVPINQESDKIGLLSSGRDILKQYLKQRRS